MAQITFSSQSEVEETIERIKVQNGVEGYVICNKQGQVLRRFPTMSLEDAERYATTMISLTSQARGVVRDLDPKVKSTLPFAEVSSVFQASPHCVSCKVCRILITFLDLAE